MITSTVQFRRLDSADFESLKQMDTGIENDYVVRIFPYSVDTEATFGAFIDNQLVCIAAYTIFAGHYAVLGRLRTDRRFRGRGIATKLLTELCRELDGKSDITWIGLATELSNHAVQHIAGQLGMKRLSTFYSCTLNDQGQKDLKLKDKGDPADWTAVTEINEKRRLLKGVAPENRPLGVFPYECYYTFPFEEALWTDEYLSESFFWKHGDQFVVLTEDEKGDSYLHMKYFSENGLVLPGLWAKVITEAERTGRILWVDLPYEKPLQKEIPSFSECVPWTSYGRGSFQTS
ncbi:MAG TPA: GNAT family N-acetyltransferase [Bacillales bacterium]